MKLKFTKLIVAATVLLLAFAVSSCKKNDVKKIEVENSFAFSIFNDDSITMAKFLDIIDSTWTEYIHVNPDGTMSILSSSDTVRDLISGRELLNDIDDVEINVDQMVTVPDLQVPDSLLIVRDLIESIPPGYPIPPFEFKFSFDTLVNLNKVASVAFNVDNFDIEEVVVKSGLMDFDLNLAVDDEIILTANIESEEMSQGSEHFNVEVKNHEAVHFNMADWSVKPVADSVRFYAQARIQIEETIINENTTLTEIESIIDKILNVSGEKQITLVGGFTGLSLNSVKGRVDIDPQRFSDIVDSLDVHLGGLSGDLGVKTPTINLNYCNTFGFPVSAIFDSLYYYNENDQYVDMIRPGSSPFVVNIESTEEGEFNSVSINDNLVPTIEIINGMKKFGYAGDAIITGADDVTVTEASHIDLTTDVEMPMNVKINELVILDTLVFGIGDSINITNYLDEIEFKFRVKNGLPLQIALQLYTCDSTLLQTGEFITDSLFRQEGANVINSSFGSGQVVNSTLYATVTGSSMNNVLNANKLILKISASTQGREVDIKATDIIGIGIGLKTKTTNVNL